jgi:hypothetical protein
MFLFHRRRDEPFSLLAKHEAHGRPSLEHYATVIPVKIRGRQVEACFLTRWDTHVRRTSAIQFANRTLARPGDPGYRRYRNLKLTLALDDPVLIRRPSLARNAQDEIADASSDVVIRLVAARPGRVGFSVTAASDQVIDTTEFDPQRTSQITEMLARLNHGDAWDRVDDL